MQFYVDGNVHNPLGGAGYMFSDKEKLLDYILSRVSKKKLKISIGSQPNSSPHFGTLETIILAFAIASEIKKYKEDMEIIIMYEIIDTAPSQEFYINNIKYQKSLKETAELDNNMEEYIEIMDYLKHRSTIDYEIRYQSEFNSQKEIKEILKLILENRSFLEKQLDPKYNKLRIRMACPKCGWTDKNSINNQYRKNNILFYCPEHGEYTIDISKETDRLEYNFPLRNLIRGICYSKINHNDNYDYQIIRITGSDYAGFYQEEMRYKTASVLGIKAHELPIIIYAPLVTDWSGAKISKSLYVKKDAYDYLPKAFVNYDGLKKEYGYKGLDILYSIIESWVNNPSMLFRSYTIYYFIKEFEKYE